MFINNPHLQTIIPALFARGAASYRRETIATYDGDFLDLDWACENHSKLVIYIHGMGGSSEGWYVKRCISRLEPYGFSALAMNLRGCGGGNRHPAKRSFASDAALKKAPTARSADCQSGYNNPGKKLPKKTYHSGMSEDLRAVIEYVSSHYDYKEIYLVGFSLGANLMLKYLGEESENLNKKILKTIAFSVPLDLESSADALARPQAQIYMRYLMYKLGKKLKKNLLHISSFHEYDSLYTAPQHGFKDAYDYWEKSSAVKFLESITIPTMIVNAVDDPFLGPECYPQSSIKNKNIEFITPAYGGHVGFMTLSLEWFKQGYWFPRLRMSFQHEQYALEFLADQL